MKVVFSIHRTYFILAVALIACKKKQLPHNPMIQTHLLLWRYMILHNPTR
ncbi:MAG: hypothetical protein R2779_05530 [Crocinitomicaceae bacterium]